ncbi:MAG: IscS subfamily cysteine desulfurase [Deltaproteobacteria bacterium]|nr:IscS subfamily cysteine desulfurase [Deltaproteobacteria bacterium]
MNKILYFDNHSTTPCDPRVVEAMVPYLSEVYGNAASSSHQFGWDAREAVEQARIQIAALIGAQEKEIIFTSGATESNNLAIKGVANYFARNKGKVGHIITPVTEHKAVLDSCHALERDGWEVTWLEVDKDGLISLESLKDALREDTAVVSVMYANNEIGVIQPIAQIGAIVKAFRTEHKTGTLFHCDAVQALGRVPIDVRASNIDLLSISGHKMYGPKGIGALFVRRGRPRIRLEALIDGGGHERGMRSGTLPVHQIVGLGKAAELAKEDVDTGAIEKVRALRNRLWDGLKANLDELYINGSWEHRLPNNLNVSFAYVEGEAMMMAIKTIACSSGSACTSASLEPSYVLRALGVDVELAHTSIRFGLGRFNTEEEVDWAINLIVGKVLQLRDMSPLYEMVKAGIDLKSIEWDAH